jgi:hypothetical protein
MRGLPARRQPADGARLRVPVDACRVSAAGSIHISVKEIF